VYLHIVVGAGGLVLLHSAIAASRTPQPFGWLTLAALAMVAGSFRLNFASVAANISIADTFFMTSALLFGPGPVTVSMAAAGFFISWRRRKPYRQIAFNTAAPALSIWAGAQTFFWIAGLPPLAGATSAVGGLVVPLLALTVVYFLLNSGLTAVVVGLDSGQSPIQIWRGHFQWLSLSYLAAASVSFCLILLIQQASLMAILVVLPLLAVFHLTLRSSFGRVEDAQRHLSEVDRLYLSTVETLAMAIDAKDDVTHNHVRRVQAYATGLAHALGITEASTLKAIEAAALLHDTGKLAVPEHILNKPGKLTTAEFDQMKRHVDVGADILSLVHFPYPVVPIVRCHHENWDGSGYPRGVAGEEIPIGARILSVVDCYDALTSDRPYRRRMTDNEAVEILRERSGRMYDPQVVDTFIRIHLDIPMAHVDSPGQREVLQRISQSRYEVEKPQELAPDVVASAPSGLLAFVSLSRLVDGTGTLTDVLALASKLLADVIPGVSGAWYLPDGDSNRLIVADAFGRAAPMLRGMSVDVGDRLTGWVAASRQPIVNSDAKLDLGSRVDSMPSLRSCMSVPMTSGPSLVAVLTLYAESADAFSGDQVRLIQMVAPHLAFAIRAAAPPAQAILPAALPEKAGAGRELRLIVGRRISDHLPATQRHADEVNQRALIAAGS
jgi:putative nucleotidyltransferase with HDIG domain